MPQPLRPFAQCARLVLVLVAFLLAALATVPAHAAPHHHLAKAGVLDLGSAEEASAVHPLHGEWGFDWEHFIDPSVSGPLPALAPVPGIWNDLTVDGKKPGPDGFGSYSLAVLCPVGTQMALTVPPQRTAMRVYVNGKMVASQGVPGSSPEYAFPAIGRRAVLTESFPCPLRVTMHISNYSHRSGGIIRTPVAGPIELLAPESQQRLALDTILLGAYLVLSISPLSFYLVRRKEKAPLVFGLYCLAQTVYADMTGERLLLQLWAGGPETPWEVFLRTEYFAWFAAMALFLLVVQQLFSRTLHRTVVRVLVGACLVGVAFVAVTPARIYSQYVVYGQLVGFAIGLYVLVSLARAARQGRPDAGVILTGMAFLALVLLTNFFPLSGDLAQRGINAVGLLAFVLSPAIVLLRRLGRALNVEESRSAEQREKVDLLVRATHAGILDWDYTRNLTRYSPRLLEMMGHPPATDTSEWQFFERVHPAERTVIQDTFINQLRDRSVRSGEMKHEPHEYRLLRRDGSSVWVHAEAISLRADDGRTLRYICSFLDITDQRAVAEGLKRQNAALAENARLREDVERMSRHDLKTPLNSIIGVSRLLREDAAVQPEHRELLTIAERAGYRMLEMVNRSLDLSRMELGTYDFRPQAVNVVDVIDRVVQDLQGMAESARVRVKLEHSFAAPVYARAEELLCYSILANLVKNAIEASPPGGVVHVSLAAGDPLQARVRNPGRVLPSIADRFFDKYVTAGKSGGTGLGTYSARLMARIQEGDLEMQTGDAGTLLTLSLPPLGAESLPEARRPPFAPSTGTRAAVTAADFAPRRVLLVDDDEYNRLLLLRYLPTPPFTVETAENGQAATEAVARHWPDIVLIDLEMPVMNGLEAVAWIRAREAREGRLPCLIVMMSSNDDMVSMRRGLEAGSNRYLTKPFSREALLAVLHALDTGGDAPQQVALELEPAQRTHEAPVPADAPVHVDTELLSEVPAFLDSRRKMVEVMATALASGNRTHLRTVAHRAAGGLALFGFEWAAWQSRQISAGAEGGDPQVLQEGIENLREHLRQVEVV